MKIFACSLAAALLVCTGVLWALWGIPRCQRPAKVDSPRQELVELARQVDALRSRQAELEGAWNRIENERVLGRTGGEDVRPEVEDLRSKVAVKRGGSDQAAAPNAEDDRSTAADPPEADEAEEERRLESLDAALEILYDPAQSWDEKEKTWARLAKQNLLDAAVAAFEDRAQEYPQNPDAQSELGNAYLRKLSTVSLFEQGPWALKADGAFDAALALDDHHWGARFLKATALSFWPAVTGKQEEAIRQFEVLRQQQEELPPQDRFARTYLFLGNLYDGRGESEKARDIWQKGAQLFPAHEELGAKVTELARHGTGR